MSKLTQSFFKLPPIAQWGIILGLGTVAFFGGKKIYNTILSSADKRDLNKEQAEAERQGEKLTYPLSQYNTFADKLEQAMFDIGTNETAVYNVFKALKNNLDFIELKKAFGERKYTGGVLPYWAYGSLNLNKWIAEEMSQSEISNINTILNNNGIKYTF